MLTGEQGEAPEEQAQEGATEVTDEFLDRVVDRKCFDLTET